MPTRNSETLQDFIKFCAKNPELRFWQALRTWANVSFILTSTHGPHDLTLPDSMVIEDTFYREGK
jgi:hypothetical protein